MSDEINVRDVRKHNYLTKKLSKKEMRGVEVRLMKNKRKMRTENDFIPSRDEINEAMDTARGAII